MAKFLLSTSTLQQQEDALRESESRFQQLFDRSPLGIFIADLDGAFTRTNTAYQAFTGYPEAELFGKTYWDLIHPDDRDATLSLFNELKQEKRTSYEKESRYLRKDGNTVWGAKTVSVLRDAHGKTSSVFGMVKDISKRKQAEADLDMYRKHLEELVASRTAELEESQLRLYQQAQETAVREERQRLARELHDSVTQLLYSINLLSSGWKKMAEDGQLVDPAASFQQLESIGLQALKEMRLLIHQLRPPILEEVGLVGALSQRLGAVEEHVNIQTELVVEGDLPPLTHFVEEQLYVIAQEALNNALQHAQAHIIFVRIHCLDRQLNLTIRDNGQGFDRDSDSKGVGLQSMQERADAIAAQLQISSEPQEGTTVQVTVAV